jgi:hypothetical protein
MTEESEFDLLQLSEAFLFTGLGTHPVSLTRYRGLFARG